MLPLTTDHGVRAAQPPAALREAIVRAGATASSLHELLLKLPALSVILALLVAAVVPLPLWIVLLFGAAAISLLLAAALIMPALAGYRRLRLMGFRRALAAMPRDQVAEVLLPLRYHPCPGTVGLVELLLGALLPDAREVSPAPPPAGLGSELAPPR